ncbi:hypothetical protein J0A68_08100 [Algoriphagus sp. H41]|uniref:D-alanyl-D-alanine carboxypeptidase n=1 Tax=Algoriphagus oliviformis TaxID=2811231 RepID=A0ABS3C1C1_9BACT|nr:DUF5715 family protein [Algoriphagus oliviformis]MBN7810912.1 hypothetical protein [Algoriphagus oliviformis]
MNKTTSVVVFAFISLFSLGTLAMVNYQPDFKKRLQDTYSSLVEEEIHTEYVELPEAKPLEPSTEIELPTFSGRLGKDAYDDHLNAAELKGIGLIQDEEQLRKLVENSVLVKAEAGAGYQVDSLTYSHPYFSLQSKKVLDEIGQTFETLNGQGNYFTVTSGTRTMEQQKKLSRRNRNATKGESSHSYGVSFDISYVRFNGEKNYDRKAQKDLEAVLNHFQKENKIFVIKERRQACYHVTVR